MSIVWKAGVAFTQEWAEVEDVADEYLRLSTGRGSQTRESIRGLFEVGLAGSSNTCWEHLDNSRGKNIGSVSISGTGSSRSRRSTSGSQRRQTFKLTVRNGGSREKICRVEAWMGMRIDELRMYIEIKSGVEKVQQILFYKNKVLADGMRLQDYGITSNSITLRERNARRTQFYITLQHGYGPKKTTHVLCVNRMWRVWFLKKRAKRILSLWDDDVMLCHAGLVLDSDTASIGDYFVTDDSVVTVRGGGTPRPSLRVILQQMMAESRR